MQPKSTSYKAGQWIFLGTAAGAFIGLLFAKFALGMIFGFFAGVVIDARKRRAASARRGAESEDDGRIG